MILGVVGVAASAATPRTILVLDGLAERMLQDAALARAPTTLRQYAQPWAQFQAWVRENLPYIRSVYDVPGNLVALYLTHVRLCAAERNVGPAAVNTASSAIACFHQLAGRASPTDHPACALVRETAARTLLATKLLRDPIEVADMRALLAVFTHAGASLMDRMHATVAYVMFLGLLRYDDASKILVHRDLMVVLPDRAELFIFKSKTDQTMDGFWVTLAALPGNPACPVLLLLQLLRAGGYVTMPAAGLDAGPLLRPVVRVGGNHRLAQVTAPLTSPIQPLSGQRLRGRLQQLCNQAGVAKHVGSATHSLRIGGASAAAELHVSNQLIQAAGRWRSAQVQQHYMRESLRRRLAVSRQLAG
jgi:hypothetical protein